MIAVAATSSGLLTVQPDKTARLPAAMSADAQRRASEQRNRRVAAAKARAVTEDAANTGPDEEHRDFGFQPDCYEEATGRNHPLQPVAHAELGEAGTGMDDQRDHSKANAIEIAVIQPRPPEWIQAEPRAATTRKFRQYERLFAGLCPPNPLRG